MTPASPIAQMVSTSSPRRWAYRRKGSPTRCGASTRRPTRASTPTSTAVRARTTATTAIPRSPRTPTCARSQGPVLRGEDGVVRTWGRAAACGPTGGRGYCARTGARSTGSMRSETRRRMPSAPRIPVRARRSRKVWCTGTLQPRMQRKPDAVSPARLRRPSFRSRTSIPVQAKASSPRCLLIARKRCLGLVELLDHLQGEFALVGVIPFGPLKRDTRVRPRRVGGRPLGVLGGLCGASRRRIPRVPEVSL